MKKGTKHAQRFFPGIIVFLILGVLLVSVGYILQNSSSKQFASVVTSTPLVEPTIGSNNSISLAKQTLEQYFFLLSTKQYEQAEQFHGAGYGEVMNWNPSVSPDDHVTLLRNACEMNGWQCLPIRTFVSEKEIVQDEYLFTVQFRALDGKIYEQGLCCGAEDPNFVPKKEFEYTVKMVDGRFKVITPPLYHP